MAESGKKIIVEIAQSTGGTPGTYEATCLRSSDIEEMVDLADITSFCTTAEDREASLNESRRKLAQLFDTSISLSGQRDGSDTGQGYLTAGASVFVRIGIPDDTPRAVSEEELQDGDTILAHIPMIAGSRSTSVDIENPTELSVDLEGNGAIKYTYAYSS